MAIKPLLYLTYEASDGRRVPSPHRRPNRGLAAAPLSLWITALPVRLRRPVLHVVRLGERGDRIASRRPRPDRGPGGQGLDGSAAVFFYGVGAPLDAVVGAGPGGRGGVRVRRGP